jgi:glycerophosphoryl diester phosphodiesterase
VAKQDLTPGLHDLRMIAHRGGAGLRVENTLAAFANAIDRGAVGAELDVHLSRDGEVVVHHDDVLNPAYCRHIDGNWIGADERLALSDTPYAELQRYDIGAVRPDTDYARRYDCVVPMPDQCIPLLRDVIRLVKARSDRFVLVIEIKTSMLAASRRPWVPLVDAMLAILAEECFGNRAILCSFDWGALLYAKTQAPHLPVWFTSPPLSWVRDGRPPAADIPPRAAYLARLRAMDRAGDAPWYAGFDPRRFEGGYPHAVAAAGGAAWFPYYRDFNTTTAEQSRQYDLERAVWSVNLRDTGGVANLASAGVHYFVSDYI